MEKTIKKEALYKTAYYRGEYVAIEAAWPHPKSIGDWVYRIRAKGGSFVVFGHQLTHFCL